MPKTLAKSCSGPFSRRTVQSTITSFFDSLCPLGLFPTRVLLEGCRLPIPLSIACKTASHPNGQGHWVQVGGEIENRNGGRRLGCAPPPPRAGPQAGQLMIHSPPGDPVGGGVDQSFSSATGTFDATTAMSARALAGAAGKSGDERCSG